MKRYHFGFGRLGRIGDRRECQGSEIRSPSTKKRNPRAELLRFAQATGFFVLRGNLESASALGEVGATFLLARV